MRLQRINACLGKLETEYGVDAAPVAATDGIQLDEFLWSTIDVDFLERNERPNLAGTDLGGASAGQPMGRFVKFELTIALKGTATGAVAPEIDVPFQAAGLVRADDAPEEGQRTWSAPSIADQDTLPSATFYLEAGGLVYKSVGTRARLTSIAFVPARLVVVKFECFGLLSVAPVDGTLGAVTYPQRALKPPVAGSGTGAVLTLDGFGAHWHTATFDMGTELPSLPRGNAPGGHAGYALVDYDATLKAVIDVPASATLDLRAKEAAGDLFGWSLDLTPGAAAFNRWELIGPAAQISKLSHAEKDKMVTYDVTLDLRRDEDTPAVAPFRFVLS